MSITSCHVLTFSFEQAVDPKPACLVRVPCHSGRSTAAAAEKRVFAASERSKEGGLQHMTAAAVDSTTSASLLATPPLLPAAGADEL